MKSEKKIHEAEKENIEKESENSSLDCKNLEALYDWLTVSDREDPEYKGSFADLLGNSYNQGPQYVKTHKRTAFLLDQINFDEECLRSLYDVFLSVNTKNLSKIQFMEFFSLPKKYIQDGVKFLEIILFQGKNFLKNKQKEENWRAVIQNIHYTNYLTRAITNHNSVDQDFFNFIMDNRVFTSRNFLLQAQLKLLLNDTVSPPKNLTLDNPIGDHASRVYAYLKGKPKKVNDDSETDSDEDSDDDSSDELTDVEMMESYHDITHLCSVAFLVPVMANFYARHGDERAKKLTAVDIKLIQIAALFHDIARQGEGEDWWDHDSGLALYYYLYMVLDVPHDKAKQLAEAVANKDAESLGFYRQLVENNDKLIWQKTTLIPDRTIERELLHAADCLEVKRVRHRFDASYLPILKVIEDKEGAVNELAQLITEVNGGIIARGDAFGNRNFMRKSKFHRAKAYEAITAIYFPESETLDEKKQDLSLFSATCPYRIIPKLYDPTGFKEEMSIDNLPTDQLLPVENDIEQKMRDGKLYARAIIRPNQYIEPKVSKRTGKPKPPETRFAFEARKISRTPEETTQSGATGKDGFGLRSGSIIGYTAQLFGGVGLIYETKLNDVIEINTHNINSGFGKKAEYKSLLEEKKLDPAHLEKKHQDLIWYVKTGCNREPQKSESAHTEVILTMKLADAKAIYITRDHIKGEPATHPYARILLAIYVQQLCEKSGKALPIVEYSNAPFLLRKMSFTDEQIVGMWKVLARNYFFSFKNRNNDMVFSMSSEELEKRCLYGGEEKGNFDDPDRYYDEALRIKLRKMLSDLRDQLLGEKVKIGSSVKLAVFTQKMGDHQPTQSSNDSTLSP